MTATYEQARHIIKSGTFEQRAVIAADPETPPEMLVFLAADSSPSVRAALATNPAVPWHAVKILASDAEELVRLNVAQHIRGFWNQRPHSGDQDETELARHSLELLAADQALAVREAIASALVDVGSMPPQLAQRLALAAAQAVAEPILRGFAQLDDGFLIDVLAARSDSWARIAIATRATISPTVAEAIVRLDDVAATTAVLSNPAAQLNEATFDYIADRVQDSVPLHEPFAGRTDLPTRIALRMAEYVDEGVYTILVTRGDFDAETAREIVAVARRRLDWLEGKKLPAIVRVRELYDSNQLNEDQVLDAIAWNDEKFISLALAVRSRILPKLTDAMLQSGNPKAVVALAWKAGISARGAVTIQKGPAGIPPHKLLHPKGGSEYPLTEAEMLWQLEFYGVKL